MNPKILLTGILFGVLLIVLPVSAGISTGYPTEGGNAIHDTATNNTYADLTTASKTTVTEFDPKQVIDYSITDTTPPASITFLSNSTPTCGSITWLFTKPVDRDYNGLYVLKNGVFFHNLSSTATNDFWTGLSADTSYTFSSQTFDSHGNLNTTFVNSTVSTNTSCFPLKPWPKVMFTFDDGNITQYSNAYPILSQYNYTGTAYVTTGSIGKQSGTMNLSNLQTLNSAGWDIANHGITHPFLTTLNVSEQKQIIRQGQENLSSWGLTRAMYHFCYPSGDYNDEVISSARSVGTLTARTTKYGNIIIPRYFIISSNLIIPRTSGLLSIPINDDLSGSQTSAAAESIITAGGNNETIVFMIHHISDEGGKIDWPLGQFTALVDWMHNNGYQTITISEWYTLNAEATASKCLSLPRSNDVASKLTDFGLMFIVAGLGGIAYILMFLEFAGRNRGDSGTANIKPWFLIGSILSIIIGTVMLCMAYEIVSADLTTAVTCLQFLQTGYV
jgi:peptidoglycan/xylan/chitin deacetylase (PgdA/CDA1 family)